MTETRRRKAERMLVRGAFGALIAAAALLAFAYLTPNKFAESDGFSRRFFMLAFFVRTFEVHIGIALALPFFVLLACRRWLLAVLAIPVFVWTVGPLGLSYVRASPKPLQNPLRVMTGNLLVGHSEVDPLLTQIRKFAPDVIFFQEYTPDKSAKLVPALAALYPFRAEGIRDHAFGEAIYSKFPFVSEPDLYPHEEIRARGKLDGRAGGEVGIWDPQIRAVIDFRGTPIVLQNVHFAPPIHSSYLHEQRIMTNWLCAWLSREDRAVIIAGDFNSTQTSANLVDLEEQGVSDTRSVASRGWAGTWPAAGLAGLFPVAIDHVLIRGLRCDFSAPGSDIASDHLPVLATVGPR